MRSVSNALPPALDAVMVWFESPIDIGAPVIEPDSSRASPSGKGGSMTHSTGVPPVISGACSVHSRSMVQWIASAGYEID